MSPFPVASPKTDSEASVGTSISLCDVCMWCACEYMVCGVCGVWYVVCECMVYVCVV